MFPDCNFPIRALSKCFSYYNFSRVHWPVLEQVSFPLFFLIDFFFFSHYFLKINISKAAKKVWCTSFSQVCLYIHFSLLLCTQKRVTLFLLPNSLNFQCADFHIFYRYWIVHYFSISLNFYLKDDWVLIHSFRKLGFWTQRLHRPNFLMVLDLSVQLDPNYWCYFRSSWIHCSILFS